MKKLLLATLIFAVGLFASPVSAAQIVLAAPVSANNYLQSEAPIVWTSPYEAYAFYVIASDAGLYYTKTLNAGDTWSSGVKIQTQADAANRIDNFSIWADFWSGYAGDDINIVWLDDSSNTVQFVALDTSTDTLGTQVQIAALSAFTPNLTHTTGGITLVRARGGNLYTAVRPSTTVANQRFFRSTNNGTSWTTRAISETPASIQTIRGVLSVGLETDTQDVYGLDVAPTLVSIKHYDDSADTWSVIHTVTLDNGITNTTCPCAMAIDATAPTHVYFGVEDGSPHDAKIIEVTNATTVVNRTNVYTDDTEPGDGFGLFHDDYNNRLLFVGVSTQSGEDRPTYSESTDGGVTWDTRTVIDPADSMRYPRVAPRGINYVPVFRSTDGANNSLEIEDGLFESLSIVITQIPTDELVDKVNNLMTALGIGGTSGGLLFSLATIVMLAILLAKVHAPVFVAAPLMTIWAGGLAVGGVMPAWIVLAVIIIGGVGILFWFGNRNEPESDGE